MGMPRLHEQRTFDQMLANRVFAVNREPIAVAHQKTDARPRTQPEHPPTLQHGAIVLFMGLESLIDLLQTAIGVHRFLISHQRDQISLFDAGRFRGVG